MGAQAMLGQWTAAVRNLLGSLHGHTAKALGLFSFALLAGGDCQSGSLAAMALSAARPASTRRRWERLLANRRWDGSRTLHRLAGALLRPWTGRHLLLVLDETPNGRDLRSLRLGVAYRKRLLTLAAVGYPTDHPPLPMPRLVCRLLRQVARQLPEGASATLLSDRGLAWPSVLDECQRLGWGHVLRLQRSTRVKLADGRVVAAGTLVSGPGQRWQGRVQIFKKAGWRQAKLTALWDARCEQPWLLAARQDSPGGLPAAAAYAKRNWCEQSFRDEKSRGFHWEQSRVRQPSRAMRLVLLMSLSTLLALSLGTWLLKSGRRGELDPHRRRRLSLFQLGLRWLRHRLMIPAGTGPPSLPCLHPP